MLEQNPISSEVNVSEPTRSRRTSTESKQGDYRPPSAGKTIDGGDPGF